MGRGRVWGERLGRWGTGESRDHAPGLYHFHRDDGALRAGGDAAARAAFGRADDQLGWIAPTGEGRPLGRVSGGAVAGGHWLFDVHEFFCDLPERPGRGDELDRTGDDGGHRERTPRLFSLTADSAARGGARLTDDFLWDVCHPH